MKTNTDTTRSFSDACLASCRKVLAQIEKARNNILAEFRENLEVNEQVLRLALNEAEALAWQTPYPQLVFADLAAEKAQAVVDWSAHQRSVRQTNSALRLTA